MIKKNYISGFTLLELVVVLTIISLFLFFSIPVLKNIQMFSNSNQEMGKVLFLIENLKKESVRKNQNMSMHIDLSEQRVWVTSETSEKKNKSKTQKAGFALSQIKILNVSFKREILDDQNDNNNEYQILFSKKGYSDMTLLHIRDENEEDATIIIEPFLLKPKLKDKYVSFEDCT